MISSFNLTLKIPVQGTLSHGKSLSLKTNCSALKVGEAVFYKLADRYSVGLDFVNRVKMQRVMDPRR